MTIGIIGAMDSEVKLYLEALQNKEKTTLASFDFYKGTLNDKEVVIVKSGIGKVNSAACAQILINKFSPEKIIFTGVAGSLNPELDVKGIVISTESIQHDVDATAFGYKRGEIPQMNTRGFKSCPDLTAKAYESSKNLDLEVMKGIILTGDQFIANKELTKTLREEFSGDCTDMESAAVAQVCHLNNIPHVIIRSMSDKADGSANVNFEEFEIEAANNSFKIVNELLKKL